MCGFVEGEDRRQQTSLPTSLEDYIGEENPIRVIDAFIDQQELAEKYWRTPASVFLLLCFKPSYSLTIPDRYPRTEWPGHPDAPLISPRLARLFHHNTPRTDSCFHSILVLFAELRAISGLHFCRNISLH